MYIYSISASLSYPSIFGSISFIWGRFHLLNHIPTLRGEGPWEDAWADFRRLDAKDQPASHKMPETLWMTDAYALCIACVFLSFPIDRFGYYIYTTIYTLYIYLYIDN